MAMDIPKLCLALEWTLSVDKTQREDATTILAKVRREPGAVQFMLNIAAETSGSIKPEVKQAAAIQYKNIIRDFWPRKVYADSREDEDEPTYKLGEADKAFIISSHIPVMCQCRVKLILRQLEDSLYFIAANEYPDGWPVLIAQIKAYLTPSASNEQLCASLYAFNCLAKVFKYKMKNEELLRVLPHMEDMYNLIYQLGEKLVTMPSDISAVMLKLVFKPYCDAISMYNSLSLLKGENLDKWMAILKKAYEWPVPPELETLIEDEEDVKTRAKLPIFKMKYVICDVFYKIFQNYGSLSAMDPVQKEISATIQSKYIGQLFEMHLALLRSSKTKFFPPRTLTNMYRFMGLVMKCFITSHQIRPLLPELLNTVAFPKLILSPKAMSVWEDDQIEVLQDLFDDEAFEVDPRSAATNLIQTACEYKGYDDSKGTKRTSHPVLNEFLKFLGAVLQESVQTAQPLVFDAALYILGKLEHAISKYPDVLAQIEPVLAAYASPGLESPIGFIRMRCCWIYEVYSRMGFKDKESLGAACAQVTKCVADQYLAVRVVAAVAISSLSEIPYVRERIKPSISTVISHFLALMGQVEHNNLVVGLENLIRIFESDIKPYSVDLIRELVVAYSRMSQKITEEDKKAAEDAMFSEGEMAAAACVSAISKVINVIGENQPMLQQVERVLMQLVLSTFKPEEAYIIENGFEVLAQLTFYCNPISAELWGFFPILVHMAVGTPEEEAKKKSVRKSGSWGFEHIRDISLCLQNYVSKDPDRILTQKCANGAYMEILMRYIRRVVAIARGHGSGYECISVIRLIITMLEVMKGKLDAYFHEFLDILTKEFAVTKLEAYKNINLQAMSMCCFYSLEQTMVCLEASKQTEDVFKTLFSTSIELPGDHIRRLIYGVVAMLEQPTKLPPILGGELGKIFMFLVALCVQILKEEDEDWDKIPGVAKKEEKKQTNGKTHAEDEEIDSSDDGDDGLGFGGDTNKIVLIDSPLFYCPMKRSVHPLFHVKSRLEELARIDMAYYANLTRSVPELTMQQLAYAMSKAAEFQKDLLEEYSKPQYQQRLQQQRCRQLILELCAMFVACRPMCDYYQSGIVCMVRRLSKDIAHASTLGYVVQLQSAGSLFGLILFAQREDPSVELFEVGAGHLMVNVDVDHRNYIKVLEIFSHDLLIVELVGEYERDELSLGYFLCHGYQELSARSLVGSPTVAHDVDADPARNREFLDQVLDLLLGISTLDARVYVWVDHGVPYSLECFLVSLQVRVDFANRHVPTHQDRCCHLLDANCVSDLLCNLDDLHRSVDRNQQQQRDKDSFHMSSQTIIKITVMTRLIQEAGCIMTHRQEYYTLCSFSASGFALIALFWCEDESSSGSSWTHWSKLSTSPSSKDFLVSSSAISAFFSSAGCIGTDAYSLSNFPCFSTVIAGMGGSRVFSALFFGVVPSCGALFWFTS